MCHGACVEVKEQHEGRLVSFHLYVCSKDQTQVVRFTGLSSLSTESSCQPSMSFICCFLMYYLATLKKYLIISFFQYFPVIFSNFYIKISVNLLIVVHQINSNIPNPNCTETFSKSKGFFAFFVLIIES